MDSATTADDFEQMYDAAPVSLWIEDFSALKALLDGLRADGVTDFEQHLAQHPSLVDEAMAAMRVLDVNQTTLRMFKAASKEELLARMGEVLRGDMRESFREELIAMWHGDVAMEIESVNYALDGTPVDILLRRGVLPGHEATWARVLISIIDISDRRRGERELAASQQHASGLFEHSPVSLWLEDYSAIRDALEAIRASGVTDLAAHLLDHPGVIEEMTRSITVVDVNARTLELFRARDKADLFGRLDEVFGDGVQPHFADELVSMWNGDLRHERESVNYTLSGEPIDIHLEWSVLPGHEHTWDRVLVSIVDITVRKRAEAYMQYLGTHDSLTGLYNRAFFDSTLSTLVAEHEGPVTVVVADLNGLKAVNDTHGHAAGDTLIRRAGEALKAASHSDDVLARIGGDEFALLLPGKVEHDGTDLLKRIRKVVEVNNQFYQGPRLTISLGAATAATASDVADAYKVADRRMYADKGSQGRGSSAPDATKAPRGAPSVNDGAS
jgi:diguanylate cyclase (GGDEF)-like protein